MFSRANPTSGLAVFLALFVACTPLQAYSQERYDLDSLVYLSKDIVVGRIGIAGRIMDRSTGYDVTELRVDSVFLGA